MAKATQTYKKTSVIIKPKSSTPSGTVTCNVCGGKGYHKKPTYSNQHKK